MKVIEKMFVAIILFGIIPLHAGHRKKTLKQMAQQLERGRCGNVEQMQKNAMVALERAENPTTATIDSAFFILSYGNTYPELTSHYKLINAAFDLFDGIPGFRQKFVTFLCTLNQKQLAKRFLRELCLAASIENKNDGEYVEDFDQEHAIGSFASKFSLRTNRSWFYWQHEQLRPNAMLDGSPKVVQFKALFIAQKIVVERFNRLSCHPVDYRIQSAYPIHKSWKRWFIEQNISARYENGNSGIIQPS